MKRIMLLSAAVLAALMLAMPAGPVTAQEKPVVPGAAPVVEDGPMEILKADVTARQGFFLTINNMTFKLKPDSIVRSENGTTIRPALTPVPCRADVKFMMSGDEGEPPVIVELNVLPNIPD